MPGYTSALNQIKRNLDRRDQSRVVLWSHLGLGEPISAARIVNAYLDSGTEVLWPVKNRNLKFMKAAFGNLQGLSLIGIPDFPKNEESIVTEISRLEKAPVIVAGHGALGPLRRAFPELPLNSLFNLSVGIPAKDLLSQDLRERLEEHTQAEVPDGPFAFIDHHPGTPREIPADKLAEIERRGLHVVQNPLGVELARIVSLLDAAEELHLVASAPLCLALTIDAKAKLRTHYDSLGDPIANGYERWSSVKIFKPHGQRFAKIGAQIKENFRTQVNDLVVVNG